MTLYYIQLGNSYQFYGPFKTRAAAERKLKQLKLPNGRIVERKIT